MALCAHRLSKRKHADMAADPPAAKRPRSGLMPPDLKQIIEKSIPVEGEIEYYTKSHKKQPGPLRHKCLPPEDLVHEKLEVIRK